jgi:CheY-like chemotaxis protein
MNMKRITVPDRVTVLVVDDDPDLRAVLSDVLSDQGCRVAEAEDGARALELLGALTPDLIITDLSMPEMTGWTLLNELEADSRLAQIPVAVLSAWAESPPPGVMKVLHKPVDLSNLLGLLDAVAHARVTHG